ncbi:S41 family peptidase [Aurantiacibacter sp. D1-12]|uniref:S41 family peptidase n=1 Tax=Aurantiacibacter sp. D1-12 TaxID=2993658 RepID=UPI00237CCD4D|nr:S41 family peptidase [Aurantiacibacter sp. D1-12]MDE1468495.1 S41 family peptidase [Aurantiacibacter sp. D1-12]
MGCTSGNQTFTPEIAASQPESSARQEVLLQLADRLEMAYLFPEWGAAYAAHLRNRRVSAAEGVLPAEDFATLITDELLAIHPDGHLRLEVMAGEMEHREPSGPPPPPPPSNFTTHHADGVSYMRIDAMFGLDETMTQLENFVAAVAPTDTVILDLRENRGGGLREMDFLFAEMFAEPTDLVIMEIRQVIWEQDGAPFGAPATLQRIDAPDGLVHNMHRAIPTDSPQLSANPVVILTSSTTGSAAEHLTMALQRTGRAMVIGEPSRGAAHFGGMLPVGGGFAAFIPAGRTFNPDTGESWEGTGNQPDIATDATTALELALSRAGLDEAQARAFAASIAQPAG